MQIEDLLKRNLTPDTLEECHELIAASIELSVILSKQIAELTDKLNLNSQNSSIPPSQDLKKKDRNRRKRLAKIKKAGK